MASFRDALKDQFAKTMRVISPPSPNLAVLAGAVRFALNAKAIRERIVAKSYAVHVMTPWGPEHRAVGFRFLQLSAWL